MLLVAPHAVGDGWRARFPLLGRVCDHGPFLFSVNNQGVFFLLMFESNFGSQILYPVQYFTTLSCLDEDIWVQKHKISVKDEDI